MDIKTTKSFVEDGTGINKAIYTGMINDLWRGKYNRLIRKVRENLEERWAELQNNERIMENVIEDRCTDEDKKRIEEIVSVYENKEGEKNNKFLRLKKRKKITRENLKWNANPTLAVVLQIFSIYYEFTINEDNIRQFIQIDEFSDDSKLCSKLCNRSISTLANYNRRDKVSNKDLIILAALLYVVNSEKENKRGIEIFPEINKTLFEAPIYVREAEKKNYMEKIENEKRQYEKLDIKKKVEYVYKKYIEDIEIKYFIDDDRKVKEITFLNQLTLTFVYNAKRELDRWKKLEIEQKKYNLVYKELAQMKGKDGEQIKLEISEFKLLGIQKIRRRICKLCALFCLQCQKYIEWKEFNEEQDKIEQEIKEEKELVQKIKEELATYEDFTRSNIINNIEFISRDIDSKIEELVNTYGNLNELGQKEFLYYIDSEMQQLDEEYAYDKFCAKQDKNIEMEEIDKLLEPMSYCRKETIYNYLLNSTFVLFSKEDWYVFSSIGIIKSKHMDDELKHLGRVIKTYAFQKRFQSDVE